MIPQPIYDADGIQLFWGDCFAVLPFLHEPVDLVVADLPYGTTRNDWDRELPNKQLWHEYNQLVRPRGAVLAFGTGSFSARFIVDNLAAYKYSLIWDKQAVSGFLNSKRQPLRCHEDINVFYRQQPTYHPQMVATGRKSHSRGTRVDRTINHYGQFANTEVVDQDGLQYPRSILQFKRPKGAKHPSQKPIALIEWLIRTYTNEGDLVLDNVCGSATTLAAARNCGRRAIGIEKRADFCDMAVARLASGATGDHW